VRICLATSGTRGDVFPFLAMGRELAARGHEIVVLTHPYFAGDVRDAGLELRPLAAAIDLDAILRDPDLFHHRRGGRVVFRWVRASIAEGVASFRALVHNDRPDLVVGHHFLLGGRQASAEAGIPFVNVCLAPCAWLARDDPSPAPQHNPGRARAAAARAFLGVARPCASALGDLFFGGPMRAAGLAHARDVFVGGFRGGGLNLGLWSRHFRAPCADDPPHGIIAGFAWHDGRPGAALDPSLERFLDSGEPPVVFAMGSAAHHSAETFFEWASRACAVLGVRGLLLTGGTARPPAASGGVHCVPYAPFGLVFPRAAATVQHGGIGSVAQALRAGRPTLVVPRAHDQFNNGVHVQRLGAGLTRPFHKLGERGLVHLLDRLLRDRGFAERAAAMGERLAGEDGARVAADHIEAYVCATPSWPDAPAPRR
jgi:hypothetical protein